jgi:hypothetical protein
MPNSLNFLREYLELILICEDKVRDLAKKNPRINVYVLADYDVSPTKKLLPWMVKQASKGANENEIKSIASQFFEYEAMLPNKDINSYSTLEDLQSAFDKLGPSKRSHLIQIKSGAVKIYEDKKDLVLRIDTKEAAQQYGKGTKWCITMEDEPHYEEYKEKNVLFYYVLKKKEYGKPELQKVALAVIRNHNNSIQEIQAFDNVDAQMTPEDAYVSEQVLEAVKSDAKKQPQSVLAKLKAGNFTDDDIKQIWNSLSSEQQKYKFLIAMENRSHNFNDILYTILKLETDPDMKEIVHDLTYDKASVEDGEKICWYSPQYELNREDDKPAIIYNTGTKIWYKNGLRHRDNDKPAVEYYDGRRAYWKNGVKYELKQENYTRTTLKGLKRVLREYAKIEKNKDVYMNSSDPIAKVIEPEIYDMVTKSYAAAGGNATIHSPSDVSSEYHNWIVADIDDDPDIDVFIGANERDGKMKIGASATDGSLQAKDYSMQLRKRLLSNGYWAEVSGAVAHIVMNKLGIKPIEDEKKVRSLLNKDIVWHGKHPEGKFPGTNGWYTRNIGGTEHIKIIVGDV